MGPGQPRSEHVLFHRFHHFSPSMTVTSRTLPASEVACINCNALAHSSASHMYLRPHRTLRFDSWSLLCHTTTNAALLERHRSKEKNVPPRFLQHHHSPQSAAARRPAHSARTLWTRAASVAPPYMFTRNVLNNLRNDDALVLLGGHDHQKM